MQGLQNAVASPSIESLFSPFKALRTYISSKGVTVFNTMSGLAVNTVSEPCQKFVGVTALNPDH